MQPKPIAAKPKYRLRDFVMSGNYATNKSTFSSTDNSCKLYCLCNQFKLQKSKKCIRCSSNYHCCITSKSQNIIQWQCILCQSKYMDPIYWPQETLMETFFKTQQVTQYLNTIEFVFVLNSEQLKRPVQLRGLQDGRNGLAWPMQGQIYLNKEANIQPIVDFKPLLKNSNRKYRRQQSIILPAQKLKVGKNVLNFVIPKLNGIMFEQRYQMQMRNVYFFGIYSIKKYSKQQLIQKTIQTSKIDKAGSLQCLRRGDGQLSVQKVRLSLECPFMKSRIKIPIRGKKCNHYMVICLDTLIQTRLGMNNREWQCPICNADINQPVVDLFILQILNDGSAGIQVQMDMNGNYHWLSFQQENLSISSDQQRKQAIKIQKEKLKNKQKQATIQKPQARLTSASKPKQVQTINLDDDDPLPVFTKNIDKSGQQRLKASKTVSNSTLQIMIPQDKPKFNKQKISKQINEDFKKAIKQGQNRKKHIQQQANQQTKKQQTLITDIRQMQFRVLGFTEFCKKYFRLESKIKINEDIRSIFKQVL